MLRQVQIMAASLIVPCTVFLAIVLARVMPGLRWGQPGVITYTGIAFAAAALVSRSVVCNLIVARTRRSIARGTWRPSGAQTAKQAEFLEQTGDAGKLVLLRSTITVVAGALIEGPAFLLLVASLVEGAPLGLIVAVLLILRLAVEFPTRSRVIRWVEGQLEELEQQRQLGV